MTSFRTDGSLQCIIVGASADPFVRYVVRLLGSQGCSFSNCPDVYSTVALLAANNYQNFLVVGRLEQLGCEGGRFFEIAKDNCVLCCCLADGVGSNQVGQLAFAARNGVIVTENLDQTGQALAQFISSRPAARQRGQSAGGGFSRQRFQATKEELDALLGGE